MSTYTPIASITLASAASSVTFSGIPQTYTDLVLVVAGGTSAAADWGVRLNADSASNYSRTYLSGDGSAASSGRISNYSGGMIPINFNGYPENNANFNSTVHIMNYTNSTTNKTVIARSNNAARGTDATVGLWRSTSAITTVDVRTITAGTNWNSGTTFNLYGIANASITNVAKATGGDSVYTDGTYWYHIFRSSGTFTPTQALTADYLVVAGGGAGGGSAATGAGGGGGAGGMRCTVTATGGGGSLESALSLTAQAYTVTVGAGGAWTSGSRTNGSNSVFSTITSTGGGGGGFRAVGIFDGASGGSGGGGSGEDTTPAKQGGAGTANQGYAGGNGATNLNNGGGGGGAGVAGGNGQQSPTRTGGSGGNGVATSISGSSVTYAGGGGGGSADFGGTGTGGTGGTGGGGAGGGTSTSSNGVAGTANTGSGGGAAGNNGGSGANGGSGIVIVRYSAA